MRNITTGSIEKAGHIANKMMTFPKAAISCNNYAHKIIISERKQKDIHTPSMKKIAEHTDVYDDMLQAIFTRETGLETHF